MPEPLQPIGNDQFFGYKHPLQPRRFALALLFALILFPLIAAALVAGTVVVIVPLFGLLLWFTGRVWYAYFLGNSILASELNYPRIYHIGEDLRALIGYPKPVNIFVYEQGNFNAYLLKFFFYRRAVFLNSELLEAGVSDDELRWLIGRFIGYLRARRQAGFWGWTIRAAQTLLVFNFVLLPYERALVYTGDRIALGIINGDIGCAVAAMQKILVGRQLGYSVNPNGLVDQHRLVKGSFFAFFARASMAFPHMTARYVDLIGFAKERFPAQYERFDAENPGLPMDLKALTALPGAVATENGRRDPVWASLAGAVAVLALVTFLTMKLFMPLYRQARTVQQTSLSETATISQELAASSSSPALPAATPVSSASEPATPVIEPISTAEAPAAAVPAAEPYVSRAGRFSVGFPGSPTQGAQNVNLSAEDAVTLHQFRFATENSSFVVMYNDYPAKYVSTEPQLLLKSIRDVSGESFKANLVSDEAIELDGVPGRAFKFADKDGVTYLERVYLNDQRLYQVITSVGAGSSASPAEGFLNSFRIYSPVQ